MEDITRELKNMRRLHKLLGMMADPDAEMDTPYAVWPKGKVGEWNPRLGIVEDPRYYEDSEDKP